MTRCQCIIDICSSSSDVLWRMKICPECHTGRHWRTDALTLFETTFNRKLYFRWLFLSAVPVAVCSSAALCCFECAHYVFLNVSANVYYFQCLSALYASFCLLFHSPLGPIAGVNYRAVYLMIRFVPGQCGAKCPIGNARSHSRRASAKSVRLYTSEAMLPCDVHPSTSPHTYIFDVITGKMFAIVWPPPDRRIRRALWRMGIQLPR